MWKLHDAPVSSEFPAQIQDAQNSYYMRHLDESTLEIETSRDREVRQTEAMHLVQVAVDLDKGKRRSRILLNGVHIPEGSRRNLIRFDTFVDTNTPEEKETQKIPEMTVGWNNEKARQYTTDACGVVLSRWPVKERVEVTRAQAAAATTMAIALVVDPGVRSLGDVEVRVTRTHVPRSREEVEDVLTTGVIGQAMRQTTVPRCLADVDREPDVIARKVAVANDPMSKTVKCVSVPAPVRVRSGRLLMLQTWRKKNKDYGKSSPRLETVVKREKLGFGVEAVHKLTQWMRELSQVPEGQLRLTNDGEVAKGDNISLWTEGAKKAMGLLLPPANDVGKGYEPNLNYAYYEVVRADEREAPTDLEFDVGVWEKDEERARFVSTGEESARVAEEMENALEDVRMAIWELREACMTISYRLRTQQKDVDRNPDQPSGSKTSEGKQMSLKFALDRLEGVTLNSRLGGFFRLRNGLELTTLQDQNRMTLSKERSPDNGPEFEEYQFEVFAKRALWQEVALLLNVVEESAFRALETEKESTHLGKRVFSYAPSNDAPLSEAKVPRNDFVMARTIRVLPGHLSFSSAPFVGRPEVRSDFGAHAHVMRTFKNLLSDASESCARASARSVRPADVRPVGVRLIRVYSSGQSDVLPSPATMIPNVRKFSNDGKAGSKGWCVHRILQDENLTPMVHLAGVVPDDVALELGAFVPPQIGPDTSWIGRGDGGYLRKLRLDPSPESEAAVLAFVEMVTYAALEGESEEPKDAPEAAREYVRRRMIDSALHVARRRAAAAASMIRSMVSGNPDEEDAWRPVRGDPFFVGTRGGLDALFSLRLLPAWRHVCNEGEAVENEWKKAHSRSIAAFADALGTLGGSSLRLNPSELPFLVAQSLMLFPRRANDVLQRSGVTSVPLRELQMSMAALQLSNIRMPSSQYVSWGQLDGGELLMESLAQAYGRVRTMSYSDPNKAFPLFGVRQTGPTRLSTSELLENRVIALTAMVIAARPLLLMRERLDYLEKGADDVEREDAYLATQKKSLVDADGGVRERFPLPKVRPNAVSDAATWGARCTNRWSDGAYVQYKDADEGGGALDDLVRTLANISVRGEDETRRFYVPFGAGVGAASGVTPMPQISEARVWLGAATKAANAIRVTAEAAATDDGVRLRLDEMHGEKYVHPFLIDLTIKKSGEEELEREVRIATARLHGRSKEKEWLDFKGLNVSGAITLREVHALLRKSSTASTVLTDEVMERVRRMMFTAERLYQALHLVATMDETSMELPNLLINMRSLENDTREGVLRALPLAFGILANVSPRKVTSVALQVEYGEVEALREVERNLRDAFQHASEILSVVPLSEACAVLSL